MKKKICLILCIALASLFVLTASAYAIENDSSSTDTLTSIPNYDSGSNESSAYETYDGSYDYYLDSSYGFSLFGNNGYAKTIGYVFITLLGYILPVFFIVFSLIRLLRAKTRYKYAWFIMTGVGVMTSVLATVFLLLSI